MTTSVCRKITTSLLITTAVFLCFGNAKSAHAFLGIGDTSFDVPLQTIASGILAKQAASTAFESKQLQSDIKEDVKEYVLDVLAYNVAQQLSTKLTNSVVNWANGGFQGAPSFVQDFGNYFKQQGDQVLQSSLDSLGGISQNNPFARDLALQLINSAQTGDTASLQQGLQFNLNQVIGPNYQQFYTNPGVGGWAGWNAVAQTQNNPIGSLLYTNQYVANKTVKLNENTQLEALGGGGFLNIKKCTKYSMIKKPTAPTINQIYNAGTGQFEYITTPGGTTEVESTNPSDCQNWETQTPGSTIKSSLDKALGVPQDRLTQADKYKELLSASLSTLITGLTNAGLKALVGSFTQQPTGSVGMPSSIAGNSWINLPNQIVDLDEVQQIRKPDGTFAINPDAPNPIPTTLVEQIATPSLEAVLVP